MAASLSVYTPVLSCVTVITNQRLILSVERGLGLKSRQIGNLPMPFMANRTNFMPTKVSPIQYGKDRTYCITSDEVIHLCSQIVRFMQYNSKKACLVCPSLCDCSLLSVVKGFQALMVFTGTWRSRTSANNRLEASMYIRIIMWIMEITRMGQGNYIRRPANKVHITFTYVYGLTSSVRCIQ